VKISAGKTTESTPAGRIKRLTNHINHTKEAAKNIMVDNKFKVKLMSNSLNLITMN
jgi:hypothetical protein